MDLLMFIPWILVSWAAIHLLLSHVSSGNHKKLPPGPRPWPIVGNLFLIGDNPHLSITELAKVYGPLMYLRLGSQKTVVISDASMAKQVLHDNDASVCSRAVPDSVTALQHHHLSLVFMPALERWRSFRRICNNHVLSNSRLDASRLLRRSKLEDLLSYVKLCGEAREAVDIGQLAFNTTLNLLSNTFFSVDLVDPDSSTRGEFKEVVSQIMLDVGGPNIADYFPVLKPFDPLRMRHRLGVNFGKIIQVFTSMTTHRLAAAKPGCLDEKDAIDALLKISLDNGPGEELPLPHIPHLLLDLFVAGTDTTSVTLEWAMAELLFNPEKMSKARQELETVVGKGIQVKEDDFGRLPYLHAIIKETLRAHATAPFILRSATSDVEICGYTIPKDSKILINSWAMGKDPSVWDSPGSFEPERFLGTDIDVKGRHFELLPFGTGRRVCPGLSLAMRILPLVLGSLINCFQWKLEDGLEPENMDMGAKFGFSLHKAQPLRAVPIALI